MSAPAERTARVLAACAELGFDDAGVASADEALFGAGELEAAAETGRLEVLPYLQDSVAERADVQRFLEGARSVLVVVQRYYRGDHEALEPATAEGAKVSRYAWGSDYHNIMRKRLRRLRKRLLRELDVRSATPKPFSSGHGRRRLALASSARARCSSTTDRRAPRKTTQSSRASERGRSSAAWSPRSSWRPPAPRPRRPPMHAAAAVVVLTRVPPTRSWPRSPSTSPGV
jgi:hypothetical protein